MALVEQATAALQARIEGGDWEIGNRLPPEQQLASQLGVGRSPVREAVRSLASIDLVPSRHGSGTYVQAREAPETDLTSRLARAPLLDDYEVRQSLEMLAAPLAARRRTDQDLKRINDALRRRVLCAVRAASRNVRQATVTNRPLGSRGGSAGHLRTASTGDSCMASSAVAKSAPRRTRLPITAGLTVHSKALSTGRHSVILGGGVSNRRTSIHP
jgi:DNA-binding transcriptional regulator YhcF (GntR family)